MLRLIIIILLSTSINLYSQNIICIQDSTFKEIKIEKQKVIITKYLYIDEDNKTYPILLNIKNGKCFINKESYYKKGKFYKVYLEPRISETISSEYGIKYSPK